MLPLPSKPKVVDKKDNKATFVIEALYPGYGVTIGNCLRRVLLSSLEGAAITEMKMKGVQHEFSTIPGLLEDVIMIMLNLKKLSFKLHTDEPQSASIKAQGEKVVKGSDFKLPPQVELANKDIVIANLTDKKAKLEMEIQIEKGLGYVPAEKRQKEKLEAGRIALDAIFTPIKRVSYRVENMRVGERTDFDRVFLEICTDGTISPEEAFCESCRILVKYFSLFGEQFKPVQPAQKKPKKESKKPAVKAKKKEKPKKPAKKTKQKAAKTSAKAKTKKTKSKSK